MQARFPGHHHVLGNSPVAEANSHSWQLTHTEMKTSGCCRELLSAAHPALTLLAYSRAAPANTSSPTRTRTPSRCCALSNSAHRSVTDLTPAASPVPAGSDSEGPAAASGSAAAAGAVSGAPATYDQGRSAVRLMNLGVRVEYGSATFMCWQRPGMLRNDCSRTTPSITCIQALRRRRLAQQMLRRLSTRHLVLPGELLLHVRQRLDSLSCQIHSEPV